MRTLAKTRSRYDAPVQPLTNLVLDPSLVVGRQVAAVGYRISHGLVGVSHADLPAHAVLQTLRGPLLHLLPDLDALLHGAVSPLGLNAVHALLHEESALLGVLLK